MYKKLTFKHRFKGYYFSHLIKKKIIYASIF
ncbi:hypothetical protein POAN111098_09145 [Polynucleobacter antarcticus]